MSRFPAAQPGASVSGNTVGTVTARIIDVGESLAFFVTVETGARGNRIASLAPTFRRVLYSRLHFVPIGDVLEWEVHLSNLASYLQARPTHDPMFWQLGRDLMDGLLVPLQKGLTRTKWSRIVTLFTYQQLESRLMEVVFDADARLTPEQVAWEAEYQKFTGLGGALPRGELLPRAMADAIVDFYRTDCQERLPPGVALFLVMRALEKQRVYAEALAARTELAFYRGVLEGKLKVDPEDDLAIQYLRALQTQEAPKYPILPAEPSPLPASAGWWTVGGVVLGLGCGGVVLVALVAGIVLLVNFYT
jgi:hypothetical protein